MTTSDEELIQAYSKEVSGAFYDPKKPITVEQLIEQSRQFRKFNREISEERVRGYINGYESGFANGLAKSKEDTLTVSNLSTMTLPELCEFIHQRT